MSENQKNCCRTSENRLSESEIRESIADFYSEIASGQKKANVDMDTFNETLGYSKEELKALPKEANMGLGCGNPQEKSVPKEGEVVVDLGCGKGMDVFIAAKKVKQSGHVIGIDMTPEMIKKAREIAVKRHFSNVSFRLGEIEHLPVANEVADLVLSNCVINLSTQKQQVYTEIFRILKPGGRIGISDIILETALPQEVLEDEKMYGTWVAGASTLDELVHILKKAGFVDIDIDVKVVSQEYADKWGVKIDLQKILRNGTITAYKAYL